MEAHVVVWVGVALIILGFAVVLAGTLLSAGGGSKADVRGGGIVFLGPIPLVFGTDRKSALAVSIIALALMLAYFRFFRR